MFLKKVPKPHTFTISNGMNMSLLPTCFYVLQVYMERLNYQVFTLKKVRLSRYGQNVCKINGKEIEYILVKNIDRTLTKEPQNYITLFV